MSAVKAGDNFPTGKPGTKFSPGMGHGQYLVYSSKSSMFEECIIVFQVFVYKYKIV